MPAIPLESLCKRCGLCCDGTLFSTVEFSNHDLHHPVLEAAKILSSGGSRFRQPCPALCDEGCRIYSERPTRCRSFNCQLLGKVELGSVSPTEAFQIVKAAREEADRIRQLLAFLGDSNTNAALSVRCKPWLETADLGSLSAEHLETVALLRLAVQSLSIRTRRDFLNPDAS